MKCLEVKEDEFSKININDLTLEALPKVVDTRGYMYIIKDKAFPDWVKVGRTVDPKKRLQAYNSDKPFPTSSYTNISKCFVDVIEAERVILEKMYTLASPSTASREWFEIEHLSTIQKLIVLAEDNYLGVS